MDVETNVREKSYLWMPDARCRMPGQLTWQESLKDVRGQMSDVRPFDGKASHQADTVRLRGTSPLLTSDI